MNENKIFSTLQEKINILFTEQQKEAVLHFTGPCLVLAVPGSGKTTVMLARTASLILNNKVAPQEILSLTYNKNMANSLRKTFTEWFPELDNEHLTFCTIGDFALSVIRDYERDKNIKFTLIQGNHTSASKTKLLRDIYKSVNDEFLSDDKIDDLSNGISYAKNMMLPFDEIDELTIEGISNFSQVLNKYELYKNENNMLDSSDMLAMCYEILADNAEYLDNYRKKYKYVQIDESQETSKIEYEILRLLVMPQNNLFLLGDDDQSIYGFKGAFPDYLLKFDTIYENAKVICMEENFRSTQSILTAADKFINKNKKRYVKTLLPSNDIGNKIKIIEVNDSHKKLDYILNLLKETDQISKYAILFRSNISMIPLVDYIDRKKIMFYINDYNNQFFSNSITVDILCFFRLAIDNSDIEAFERIYYKTNSGFNKNDINYLKENVHSGSSIFDQILSIDSLTEMQRTNMHKLKDDFDTLSSKLPYEAIEYINSDLGYFDYCHSNSCYSQSFMDLIFSSIKVIAFDFKTLREFGQRIDELQLIMANAVNNENSNAVTLSTLHSSKGLEFDNVIITDLLDGIMPSTDSINKFKAGDHDALENERKLIYVAMTRARKELDLIVTKYENGNSMISSRFIDEIMSGCSVDYYRDAEEKKGNTRKNREYVKYVSIASGSDLTEISDNNIMNDSLMEHKKYGKGRVVSDIDNNLTIDFLYYGIKTFDKKHCIANSIIKVLTHTFS